MATQVEPLQPELLTTMIDDQAPMDDRRMAAQQVALWAERVFQAIRELQDE